MVSAVISGAITFVFLSHYVDPKGFPMRPVKYLSDFVLITAAVTYIYWHISKSFLIIKQKQAKPDGILIKKYR